MIGQQLIDFIKENGLEGTELKIEFGGLDNGEKRFVKIKEIKTYDSYYYATVIIPEL